jgi:formylglycine-generating enzyme required for sulfatase activity
MNETDRHVLYWPEAGVEMAFRLIPPGEFRMGTRKTEWPDEEPAHTVRILRPFWLGETPVTQEQFDIWKRAEKVEHEYFFEGQAENPAENMSWRDAITYCSWLAKTKRTKLPPGHSFVCLPTEAEWEYACRAGTETAYHTGDGEDDLADAGWFLGNSKSTTHLVGRKKANAFGLHDMHGNVREWCHDGWNEEAYEKREDGVRDPASRGRLEERRAGLSTMLNSSLARVLRGGSWGDWAADCRSANRFLRRPFVSGSNVGFRVCLARGPAPSRYRFGEAALEPV